jgi:hypothetical protein
VPGVSLLIDPLLLGRSVDRTALADAIADVLHDVLKETPDVRDDQPRRDPD